MKFLNQMYDDLEDVHARFVGFSSSITRYDFAIFAVPFFTKPLVVCLQTSCSTLLDIKDLDDRHYLQKAFQIESNEQTAELIQFFKLELNK
ncbi:SAV0927 family protein [Cytobacillus sp. FSL W7-1323]|uniref:DUF3055 domain-containing protein n=1 Tax=Cytobacillus kochii TaxID=859143 RepID=A0A248TDA9_9BACI|nr:MULTISPECIES: SAV0927 family protein [Cytobacillus]ASV66100.1 hypothetical protein CKF48_01400 [Cytobacillus kochii]MDQ0184985.1 hypothetical protein [Cytobacillus kochii]MEA1851801.1 DUF3055 family protein [Cytobacillus sp. OWB-43]MED1606940.1 DUF3055 family protein [Cytobacillus kochii]